LKSEGMHSEKNKNHWNQLNIRYSDVWKKRTKKELSQKESGFIKNFLTTYKPLTVLDVGIGTGRILEVHIQNTLLQAELYGVDISDEMVKICREKFKNSKKIKRIETCDVAAEKICFDKNFDFVTAIRILKYNPNWKEIIKKIRDKMNKDGVFIFTMPNIKSISFFRQDTFSQHKLPIFYTHPKELMNILKKIGFSKIEITSFSKLPNFLYELNDSYFYTKTLFLMEKIFEMILGKKIFGRILFVKCLKT
jgi:ubiquinone/menaquinone biosynthesis C-methylase UbiE